MINKRRGIAAIATFGITSLVLAGCSAGDNGGSEGGNTSGDATAIISTNGTEPQNPLIPTNTTEVGGGKILDLIFAGLVAYDAKGGIEMENAESIEANDDNTVWTVKLKDGLTFTNGEKVTADSYIKAWNFGALKKNAQSSSYFFDNIKGYSADEDSELTGLKKTDDLTFTVELTNAEADFPVRLGYTAYRPLPEAAYEDMKAFGESPIGNGPYKFASEDAWSHDEGVELVTNEDYDGVRKPVNGGVSIKFYTSQDTAYSDTQSGNLDVLDQVPSSTFSTYADEFGDRSVNQPAAIFQSFTIPQYLEHFGNDEEGKLRRQAISMSVDRDSIIDAIFDGTRTAAKDFTSPVIDGWSDKLPGNEVLSYDPKKAKELWAKADAISKYDDTFKLAYNADGDHEAWVTAATNSIADSLDIKAEPQAYATFAELLDDENNDKMTGAFRSGWQADYPSMVNFLAPLYQTGAGSNYGRYSSDEFDGLLKQGGQAASIEDATKKYEQAQEVLLKDLPVVPLWYSNVNGVWADTVSNVEYGWNSVPLYYAVTKG